MNKFEIGMPVVERPEQKKEAESVILAEKKNLESTIKIAQEDLGIEKSEDELSNDIHFKYAISKQERLDSVMDPGKSGWTRYWIKRLIPEIELLPKDMQKLVRDYQMTKKYPSDISVFQNYVNKRVSIKRFELRKREEMAKLKMDLRAIDSEKSISPEDAKNRRMIYFDEQAQSFYMKDEKGNIDKKNISFGDLVGDYAWGIKYQPDKTVPHKVWRKIRKTLSLYEARNRIEDIFNDELSQTKGVSLPTSAIGIDYIENFFKKKGHPAMGGTIAERMITEFLTRVQYNNPELGMKVEHSNAIEDAVLKYDFKIVIDKLRGIALESEERSRDQFVKDKRKVGVQFTIDSRPETEKKKLEQISKAKTQLSDFEKEIKRKVDDIVLVKIPSLGIFSGLYFRWLQEGKPSGGPEQYLTREQKLEIFKQAMSGLLNLSDEELNSLKI